MKCVSFYFILLICGVLHVISATQISEILRTPQFMLITQFKCQTMFEAYVQKDRCPAGLSIPRSSSQCDTAVRAHLIRDPLSLHAPKVLFLGADRTGKAIAYVENIQIPHQVNTSESAIRSREMNFVYLAPVFYLNGILYKDITGSILDTDGQLLYLLTKQGPYSSTTGSYCFVFFLRNTFGSSTSKYFPSFEYLYNFPMHAANGARYDWTSDPYSNEVYYTTRREDITSLHAAPLSRLMSVLKEGANGLTVHVHAGDQTRSHFRVSGGAMFSYSQQEESDFSYIRSLYHKEEGGIFCETSLGTKRRREGLPAAAPIIIVRDYDFCLLRDKEGANEESCTSERNEWLIEHGMLKVDDGSTTNVTFIILLVTVIVLFIIVLLLVLCLCWMRQHLDDSFIEETQHQPMPYYPNHPDNYPDMDVSVDKWNY